MIHSCVFFFGLVIVVHESLVCPKQLNCAVLQKNPSGPTHFLVFQHFCVFELGVCDMTIFDRGQ